MRLIEDMNDLISRQAAIDAINTWEKFGVDERSRIVRWHEGLEPYVHLRDVLAAIVNLPPAQPTVALDPAMVSHEQLAAPKGFIMVHSEGGDVYYVNVDYIAGFSKIEYNDGCRATVLTLVYKLTTDMRDFITVSETPSEICTLINNARR